MNDELESVTSPELNRWVNLVIGALAVVAVVLLIVIWRGASYVDPELAALDEAARQAMEAPPPAPPAPPAVAAVAEAPEADPEAGAEGGAEAAPTPAPTPAPAPRASPSPSSAPAGASTAATPPARHAPAATASRKSTTPAPTPAAAPAAPSQPAEPKRLGVTMTPVSAEQAATLRLASASGALVTKVKAGSPAERAGMQANDVIRSCEGQPVASPNDIGRILASAGDKVTVEVWRSGKTVKLQASFAP